MRVLASLALIALSVAPLVAQEPAPRPREPPEAAESMLLVPLPRPRREPQLQAPEPAPAATEDPPGAQRPRIYQAACPAVLASEVEARLLPPIADGLCTVQSPLAVAGILVNGRMVPLSTEATVTCGMATALPQWAGTVDSYLAARENTRIAQVLVGTSYMCRPRNNVSGAEVSEHGFANALDVVGFVLEDGRSFSLPNGWADPLSPAGRLLRFAHDAGCATFTTTLGPEANALHRDHLHLDLGCHDSRCVARLCE